MWIKKDIAEESLKIAKANVEHRKTRWNTGIKYLIYGILIAVAFRSISLIVHGEHYNKMTGVGSHVKLKDLPAYLYSGITIAICIFFAILGFVFGFVKSDIQGLRKYDTQLCIKCGSVRSFYDDTKCECGGEYDLIDKYKWIEEPETKYSYKWEGDE